MPSWLFFRNRPIGWIGHALLVQPSKSNRGNWKVLFILGSYEYLERLKGKIRDGIFFAFINQIITVCTDVFYSPNQFLALFATSYSKIALVYLLWRTAQVCLWNKAKNFIFNNSKSWKTEKQELAKNLPGEIIFLGP